MEYDYSSQQKNLSPQRQSFDIILEIIFLEEGDYLSEELIIINQILKNQNFNIIHIVVQLP